MLQSEYSVMSESQVTKRQKTVDRSSRPEWWITDTWLDNVSGSIPDGVAYNLRYMYIWTAQQQLHIRRSNHWRRYRNVMVQLMCCRNADEGFYNEEDIEVLGWKDYYNRSHIMESDSEGINCEDVLGGYYASVYTVHYETCLWFSGKPFHTD